MAMIHPQFILVNLRYCILFPRHWNYGREFQEFAHLICKPSHFLLHPTARHYGFIKFFHLCRLPFSIVESIDSKSCINISLFYIFQQR